MGAKTQDLGAPGRVFLTGEPEMTHNLPTIDIETYKRAADAKKCSVFSTMVMPLYGGDMDRPIGVVETCSMDPSLPFDVLMDRMDRALAGEGLLRTCPLAGTVIHTTLRMLPPGELSTSVPGQEDWASQDSNQSGSAGVALPSNHHQQQQQQGGETYRPLAEQGVVNQQQPPPLRVS